MNHITNTSRTTIEQMTGQLLKGGNKVKPKQQLDAGSSFRSVLLEKQQESQNLKFSKHASQRLESRNISLSNEQMDRLTDGANKAKTKGIQESLVLVDDLAFIVNTKNNTVVTAVNELESSVFTNIDGAVIN